jgi:two-component system OmpR family sensor kinase
LLAHLLVVALAVLVGFDAATVTALRHAELTEADALLRHMLHASEDRAGDLLAQERAEVSPPDGSGLADGDHYLAIVTGTGQPTVIIGTPRLGPALPTDLASLAGSGAARTVAGLAGGAFRIAATRTSAGILVAGVNLSPSAARTHRLVTVLGVGTFLAVLLLCISGAVVVRRDLQPLETMAAQADRINAGDLSHRVRPEHPQTEVGRLGQALNRMLARIEASVRRQEDDQTLMRQFFADASHTLRTPLTSLRATAELYEQGALPRRAQVDEAMHRIHVSARRMSTLVDDMLRLARLDQRPPLREQPVDLSTLVTDGLADARAAAPTHTWIADIQPGITVTGDPELLRRALDNLLTNVRVHTPAGTMATVAVHAHDGRVELDVADDGPGVPRHALPHLFDRFYRSDPTRPGSGLGLAIVAQVAATHSGHAHAVDAGPGLRVRFTLPLSGSTSCTP